MRAPKFQDAIGGTLTLGALALVGWAIVVQIDRDALTAVTTVLGIAAGYYLRGRVTGPSS